MSFKRILILVAPLLLLSFVTPQEVFSQESTNCLICHSAMKGRLETAAGVLIELNIDTDRFQSSVHGFLSCTDCHLRFSDNPHSSPDARVPSELLAIASEISSKYPVDPVAAAACDSCHEVIYQKVLDSVHGRNITVKNQTDGALCLDCHGSPHYITPVKDVNSPVGRWLQAETCGRCHGDRELNEKYDLEENVMESYEESFHARKLHLGHTGAPLCSSCHNAHDIKSKDDPDSTVFGKNRIKTCGKCHAGANEKFIPAITHKPAGPIPYYTEKLLIVLTMGVFAFIVLHVIAEALSDIRDAIFRKKEGSE